ncbi:AsmA family protein [Phenylobacterium sp. LjRoot164]|uniref:AsmA family protein n=1 Tax=unclassified Phenylobacterium TaxID=2640670 RepID=UPI003ECE995A
MPKDASEKPQRGVRHWIRAHRKGLAIAAGSVAVVVGGGAVLLALLDWNQLRGPISRFASARLDREVAILGDLDVRPFSFNPSASVERLQIGQPAWAGKLRMAEIERLDMQIEALPLLRGQLVFRRLEITRPNLVLLRDAKGRANWSLRPGAPPKPLRLPPIQDFRIEDGRMSFKDARRRLSLEATMDAAERRGAANPRFVMSGKGAINGAPFSLALTGGPLVNVRAGRPYPFDADVRAGATRIMAKGQIDRPFDLGRFEAQVTASGPDLANLYELTGIAFPNSPPYRLSGQLSREQRLWRVNTVGGRVGDSDMAGNLSVNTAGERPFLTADLRSKRLDFDDLASVFGGAPGRGVGETASPNQQAVGQQMAAQRRLLPDAKLDISRIRAMDADVKYAAASIVSPRFPVRAGSVHIKLKDGVLDADPLRLDLKQGALAGQAKLDARRDTPVTSIDLRLSRARLEDLIPIRSGGTAPITGALVGRVKLTGAGASVREAAGHADGQALFVVPGGEIRAAFAELMGVNVTKGLGLLLAKDQSKTDLRCAVAHFQAKDGVLTANRIILDTTPVLSTGEGRIDLRDETMNLRMTGHAKEPRLIRLTAPVTIEGPIVKPKLGVEASGAIAQGGVAAALGALVAPLAAVLPFVDLGLAEDASCGALIAQAGRQGAPVAKPRT